MKIFKKGTQTTIFPMKTLLYLILATFVIVSLLLLFVKMSSNTYIIRKGAALDFSLTLDMLNTMSVDLKYFYPIENTYFMSIKNNFVSISDDKKSSASARLYPNLYQSFSGEFGVSKGTLLELELINGDIKILGGETKYFEMLLNIFKKESSLENNVYFESKILPEVTKEITALGIAGSRQEKEYPTISLSASARSNANDNKIIIYNLIPKANTDMNIHKKKTEISYYLAKFLESELSKVFFDKEIVVLKKQLTNEFFGVEIDMYNVQNTQDVKEVINNQDSIAQILIKTIKAINDNINLDEETNKENSDIKMKIVSNTYNNLFLIDNLPTLEAKLFYGNSEIIVPSKFEWEIGGTPISNEKTNKLDLSKLKTDGKIVDSDKGNTLEITSRIYFKGKTIEETYELKIVDNLKIDVFYDNVDSPLTQSGLNAYLSGTHLDGNYNLNLNHINNLNNAYFKEDFTPEFTRIININDIKNSNADIKLIILKETNPIIKDSNNQLFLNTNFIKYDAGGLETYFLKGILEVLKGETSSLINLNDIETEINSIYNT